MRVETHYLIRPNNQLLELSTKWSQDVYSLLRHPLLWTKEEGGHTAWSVEEYSAQVKLLFLLWLKSNFVDHGTTDVAEIMQSLLGEPPYNLSTFDRWWIVERFAGQESFEAVQDSLNEQYFAAIGDTNMSRVDQWITNMTRKVASTRTKS